MSQGGSASVPYNQVWSQREREIEDIRETGRWALGGRASPGTRGPVGSQGQPGPRDVRIELTGVSVPRWCGRVAALSLSC